ncbi:MAG: hypothetical protein SX243_00405 [Acidobacteriota bacterium]|nr:hypothetical protein [Acidobacteriota bacterium]
MSAEPRLTSAMDAGIAETLETVAGLASPVVRTCHVGNNTSNVWGWLALAGNAYLGQYDHTLYGVDENCIPWVLLGDDGVVEACFDHKGQPRPEEVGQHVNQHLAKAQRKYFAHLNFGIFGQHQGEDLITSHYRLAERLSRQMNGRGVRIRSQEVLDEAELFRSLIHDFFRHRKLDLLFNRWVRTTGKKGYAVAKKIRSIEYGAGGRATITAASSGTVFEGTAEELMEAFLDGMAKVSHRIRTAEPLGKISYPWFENFFNFLTYAAREHRTDPDQRVFWHAGGSSSQYYIHHEWVQSGFAELTELLEAWGYLPVGARVSIIPTFCCQLFATTEDSLPLLEALLAAWQEWLEERGEVAEALVQRLNTATDAFAVGAAVAEELAGPQGEELVRRMDAFNGADRNRLPIAHAADLGHPTYNKFGVAQHHLLGVEPLYPWAFRELTWGQAELLIKALGHLTIHRSG